MPSKIKVYDLLISCPSDVSEYIDLLEKGVNSFNNHWGRSNGIIIRTNHWSRDTRPQFGDHPQDIINSQMVKNCDFVIAVFWTRFGTKTKDYGAGTEDEIETMHKMGKQIFLYFLDKPINPLMIDQKQYSALLEFRERHKKDSLFFSVSNEKELASTFQNHLELYFDQLKQKERTSKKVLWVDDQPDNNIKKRNALEQYGLTFTLASSTDEALNCIRQQEFALIISDMGRKEGKEEGYVLLEKVRQIDKQIPFIIHSRSKNPRYFNETSLRGGQGYVTSGEELIVAVIKLLPEN